MKAETACVHGAKDKNNTTGAAAVPIYQAATFSHLGVNSSTGYDYSRLQNPTREALENLVSMLEGAADTLAFSTGMAAVSAVMELFSPGSHIIATDDLYGGSIRLFENISKKNGINVQYINTCNIGEIKDAINENTRAVFIETPTNPMMRVTDISSVAEILRDKDILLIADNTFLTPYFQKPLNLGADIVLHSGTKYLGGHNDTLAGFLAVKSPDIAEKLRFIFKTTGACLAPFDSFLIIRGIKTLALRMEKAQANAAVIANWLLTRDNVSAVYYTGLKTHPEYEISIKQASGFGAMISFEVDTAETARRVLERVKLIMFAESLGGVETLITYPTLQTHADVPAKEKEGRGINDSLLRLSVGIENAEDLIEDLRQALEC